MDTMDISDKEEKAIQRYNDLIHRYQKQSDDARVRYYYFQGSVIILTALTPVLVVAFPEIKVLHALLPALASIAAGWLTLKQFKDQWRRRILAANALNREYSFFDTQCGVYNGLSKDDAVCHFIERIEHIIETENSEWEALIHKKELKNYQQ